MNIKMDFNYVDSCGNKILITGLDPESGLYFGMDARCNIRLYDKEGRCHRINALRGTLKNNKEELDLKARAS